MRIIDADAAKADIRKDCPNCTVNGSSFCKTECIINLRCEFLDEQPTAKGIISARDFKKRINNMEYVYLQACAEDVIDAIDCEVTYFKEKQNNGKK